MNRKQRTCIYVGFVLVVLETLFPPWEYRGGTQYEFLFRSHNANLGLSQLVIEWLVVVFVISGLALALRDGQATGPENMTGKSLAAPARKRFLAALTIILVVLALYLGYTAYSVARRAKQLETGIQNLKVMIYADNPEGWGYWWPQGNYQYSGVNPSVSWFPCPDSPPLIGTSCRNIQEIQKRDRLLKRIIEQLDPL
jgi:hypothetical protein